MTTRTPQAERIAALEVEVKGLREDVAALTKSNKELTAALNQGKGGIAVISFIVGSSLIAFIGAIQGWFK